MKRRMKWGLILFALVSIALGLFVDRACAAVVRPAHHADITAVVTCSNGVSTITGTVTDWINTSPGGDNPDIRVTANGATVKDGFFNASQRSFTFTFTTSAPPGTTITFTATAIAEWADLTGPGDARSATVVIPVTCVATTTTTAATTTTTAATTTTTVARTTTTGATTTVAPTTTTTTKALATTIPATTVPTGTTIPAGPQLATTGPTHLRAGLLLSFGLLLLGGFLAVGSVRRYRPRHRR